MKKFTRRKFLAGSVVLVSAASIVPAMHKEDRLWIETVIDVRFSSVDIPGSIKRQFVDDFVADAVKEGDLKRFTVSELFVALYKKTNGGLTRYRRSWSKKEEIIVTRFLLATNMLTNSRVLAGLEPIGYSGLKNRSDACGNPFARFDFS